MARHVSQDSRIFLIGYFDDWLLDRKFGALNEFVPDFRIVNDIAESAIQVLTDYTESITKNKAQRKFLIADTVPQHQLNKIPILVKKHRKNQSKWLLIKKISTK